MSWATYSRIKRKKKNPMTNALGSISFKFQGPNCVFAPVRTSIFPQKMPSRHFKYLSTDYSLSSGKFATQVANTTFCIPNEKLNEDSTNYQYNWTASSFLRGHPVSISMAKLNKLTIITKANKDNLTLIFIIKMENHLNQHQSFKHFSLHRNRSAIQNKKTETSHRCYI